MSDSLSNTNNNVAKFKFWCQKVLPAVYDDSLSYYELLCKVMSKLNEVIDVINTFETGHEDIYNRLDNLDKLVADLEDVVKADYDELKGLIGDNKQAIEDNYNHFTDEINELKRKLKEIVSTMRIYDPTKGYYTNSVDSIRRVVQLLATPADEVLNVTQVGKLTTDALKKYTCGELVNSSFRRNTEIPFQETHVESDVDIYKFTRITLDTGTLSEAPTVISEVLE